jgi:hypothetical protein
MFTFKCSTYYTIILRNCYKYLSQFYYGGLLQNINNESWFVGGTKFNSKNRFIGATEFDNKN